MTYHTKNSVAASVFANMYNYKITIPFDDCLLFTPIFVSGFTTRNNKAHMIYTNLTMLINGVGGHNLYA